MHLRHLASHRPSVRLLPRLVARLKPATEAWPQEALGDFSLRMAGHGLSVSSSMMRGDPGYALEQLGHAQALPDEGLHQLADDLVRDLERRSDELGQPS